MSHVFYETLEKRASIRLMKALKRARDSTLTKKDIHMLTSRGYPTDSTAAYKKMDDLFAESLRAQAKSRARIANTRNNEKYLEQIDDKFNRLRSRIAASGMRTKQKGHHLDRGYTLDHLGGYGDPDRTVVARKHNIPDSIFGFGD